MFRFSIIPVFYIIQFCILCNWITGMESSDVSSSPAFFNLLDCPEVQTLGSSRNERSTNASMINLLKAMICRDINQWLTLTKVPKPRDCEDIHKATEGNATNGVYKIFPTGNKGFWVYCDMTTAGGGWTVFQRRFDGSVDFYRGWKDYKHGFGILNGEFWLGNDKLNSIVSQGFYKLRIDLEDFENGKRFAEYKIFNVASEGQKYLLTVKGYSGNAGDSLSSHSNYQFSTRDRDNDGSTSSCSHLYKGSFWYESCHKANLNGLYLKGTTSQYGKGVVWSTFRGYYYSLKTTDMMVKRN